jgi:plasmid stabilization system protein ParE
MGNTYKIIWSDEALSNLKGIIRYLEKKWTNREIKRFAHLLDKNLALIKENPKIFPRSDTVKGFRRAVISKQVSLYYRTNNQIVHIVSVFDNRQNPSSLKRE